jgi:putative iron-dependent peroxidase
MNHYQAGIRDEIPLHSRYLFYSLIDKNKAGDILEQTPGLIDGQDSIIGIGESTLNPLNLEIPGMRSFPVMTGPGIDVPSTPYTLMIWLWGYKREVN